ncbi:MAG TPA: LuxR C-terminal-related transcriptional regulator [Chthoniobacterales bacterium]|jgi:DNA-binding CsgD family transcriptional regulator|nr:LuxR C-terminal-related transcriptional regulator [Chthoniobacterales bacterium]
MHTVPFPISSAGFPLHQVVCQLLENALEQALLITNDHGEVLFATRQTRLILRTFFTARSDSAIPEELLNWLVKGDTTKPLVVHHPDKGEIEVHNFPLSPSGSLSLIRLEYKNSDYGPKALRALGLTAREAEVLYWITEGKTNPEIAIILDASTDTVKKHAANLYAKLGVPTRTSAARCALPVLLSPLRS